MLNAVPMQPSDASLVAESLTGNREAFGQIVAKYQTLVSSLAYSRTGDLSQSQDVAQETFIAAWKQLPTLQEPNRLRAWLCGIARHRIYDALRKQGREPSHAAEALEAVAESPTDDPLPGDFAISNEEAAILWRSLERIPEMYREPLVLFYREHQSVEAVATALDLTQDTVKQRLARGRRMLHDQVLAFIEGALTRTRPEKAFTLAVLASLPALTLSANAATATAMVKGATTAKAVGTTGVLSLLLGPLTAAIPNYFAYRVSLASAETEAERREIKKLFGTVAIITTVGFVPIAAAILWLTRHQTDRSFVPGLLASSLVLIFLPTMFGFVAVAAKRGRELSAKILAEEFAGVFPKPRWEYRSRWTFLGLPLVHIRICDRFAVLRKPVKAWIAIGHAAIGGLFALGALAVAPIGIGGFSVGILSLGGVAVGGVALGGIAAGAWPIFGGLVVGWQAFNGCFALGWNAAVGLFAGAHDFALGRFVFAPEANTDLARQVIFPNVFFRSAEFIGRHWYWLNLLWVIPFMVQWLVARTPRSTPPIPTEPKQDL